MTLPQAVFRTDASVARGLGHLMRCRALAEEWTSRGGRTTSVVSEAPEGILESLRAKG